MILAGDFNINVLDFEQNKKVQNFVNLMFQFGLVPTINKPTRVTNKTISAIDYIITNFIYNNDFKTAIIRTDISDHFPITYTFKLRSCMCSENHQKKNRYLHKRIINESSKATFKHRLRKTSWEAVKGLDNPNESYVKFIEIIMQIYDDYRFPKTKFKIKSNNKANPWITKGIAKSSKHKQKLYEKLLKTISIQNEKIYKDYRKLFETITMKSKRKY